MASVAGEPGAGTGVVVTLGAGLLGVLAAAGPALSGVWPAAHTANAQTAILTRSVSEGRSVRPCPPPLTPPLQGGERRRRATFFSPPCKGGVGGVSGKA